MSSQELFTFLTTTNLFPKFYWEDRLGSRIAACGAVQEWETIPDSSERVYGGIAFSNATENLWAHFPKSYFFLPAQEWHINAQGFYKVFRANESITRSASIQTGSRILSRVDTPTYPHWEDQVTSILNSIAHGYLDKAVLARRTELLLDQASCPWQLLAQLKKNLPEKSVTFFCLQLSPRSAFLGATPERLYRRDGKIVQSEALAATALSEKDLLGSFKLKNEFSLVKQELQDLFSNLCSHHTATPSSIKKSAHLFHIYQQFSGCLNRSYTDQQLIQIFHPTSAIGGLPKKEALRTISALETCQRGWYSGPIGWASRDAAEFCVAIRSALMQENRAHLFAGTGIVAGSSAQEEWEELNQKIRTLIDALESTSH